MAEGQCRTRRVDAASSSCGGGGVGFGAGSVPWECACKRHMSPPAKRVAERVRCHQPCQQPLLYLMIFSISSPAYFALTRARISRGTPWGMHRDGLEPKTRVKLMKISIRTGTALQTAPPPGPIGTRGRLRDSTARHTRP